MNELFKLVKEAYEKFYDLMEELLDEIIGSQDYYMEPISIMTRRGSININPLVDIYTEVTTTVELKYQLKVGEKKNINAFVSAIELIDGNGTPSGILLKSPIINMDEVSSAIKKYFDDMETTSPEANNE